MWGEPALLTLRFMIETITKLIMASQELLCQCLACAAGGAAAPAAAAPAAAAPAAAAPAAAGLEPPRSQG